VKPADSATDERLLLQNQQNKSPVDWSNDGRTLLYATADLKTASDLWALPMAGATEGRQPFPVVNSRFDEIQGQFSPDGQWIAYASDEAGRYDVYVRPFPGPTGRIAVSTAGGTAPRWSRDGRELFYVALDNHLMAVPIRPGRDPRTLSPGTPVALFLTRLVNSGSLTQAGFNSAAQYELTADGHILMNVNADDAGSPPISIVLNWPAAIQK
jgi:dipeptidyl aminopeptidase/acylaminoacyl peptidase